MSAYRDAPKQASDPEAEAAKEALALVLHRDEELLWAGRPRRGVFVRGNGVRVSFVGVALVVIVVCVISGWLSALGAARFPGFAELREIASALFFFGLAMIFVPFYVDARERERTFYGVTNGRVLIVLAGRIPLLTQFDLRRTTFALWPRDDGRGTIALTLPPSDLERVPGTLSTSQRDANGDPIVVSPPTDGGGTVVPRLRNVPNAQAVHDLLVETKRRLAPP